MVGRFRATTGKPARPRAIRMPVARGGVGLARKRFRFPVVTRRLRARAARRVRSPVR
jgi:hypothetical protein